jgi:hypothetical protein
MRTLLRCGVAGVTLAAAAWLLAGPGAAGEGKVWDQVIPEGAYKELVKRAVKTIQDEIDRKGRKAHERAQVEAVRVAAYTLTAKGRRVQLTGAVYDALQVAKMIGDGKDLGEAKRLAKALPGATAAASGPFPDFAKYLDVGDLMNLYRQKKKGGEGLAEALQSTRPLKNTNGVEDKITYLAKKQLKPAMLAKESKELALLGYELAADGSLTSALGKTQAKKGPEQWREFALAQRDAAVRLAEGAAKQDAAAVHKAAVALEASCTGCHNKFRSTK